MLVRGFLALPHVAALVVFGVAALAAAAANWLVAVVLGRSPRALHDFLADYVRYLAHVSAYLLLLADPYPGFAGGRSYPVDVEIEGPERQRRAGVLLRAVLALPSVVLAWAFGAVASAVSFAGWFVSLVLGRMPRGMRDLAAYCLRYELQALAYLVALTPRYPTLEGAGSLVVVSPVGSSGRAEAEAAPAPSGLGSTPS